MPRIKEDTVLWSRIQKYLSDKGYVVKNPAGKDYMNIKVGRYNPDVVGVKNIGDKLGRDVEIVAVEAKTNPFKFTSGEIGKASNYKSFAHYVYLATVGTFTGTKAFDKAKDHGLGLLELKNKKAYPKSVWEPIKNTPTDNIADSLYRLGIGQCSICRRFLFHESKIYGLEDEYKSLKDFYGEKKEWYVCTDCASLVLYFIEDFAEDIFYWGSPKLKKAIGELVSSYIREFPEEIFESYNLKVKKQINSLIEDNREIRRLMQEVKRLKKKIK